MFDVCIFVSSEDDKYLVYGGIGTYLGVLTKSIRNLYPSTEVYWIAKSPNANDFYEEGEDEVKRIYLSEFGDETTTVFFRKHTSLKSDRSAKYTSFISRVEEMILKILRENEGKSILLEVGEWEGQAHSLFSLIQQANLLKVTRLHTPLTICFAQNYLAETGLNHIQMLNEYKQIKYADLLSACTKYMKERVIEDLLGRQHPLSSKIIALPNPIDVSVYRPDLYTREQSLAYLHNLIPHSVDEKTFNVFVVGSVESRKGVEYVMRAVPHMSEAIPHLRVCFLGHYAKEEGEWSTANAKLHPKQLYRMIPERYHRNVVFFNYIPHTDLPLAIEAGDLFPVLAIGDNFPGAVAEIALSSKPIIALERGGVREMLQDAKGDCVAFSVGDRLDTASERLADAVKTLFLRPELRQTLGQKLRSHFCHKYDPSLVVPLLMETYWEEYLQKQAWGCKNTLASLG